MKEASPIHKKCMSDVNRPYAIRINLGKYPYITAQASFSFSFLKVGVPPLKINIFQRFKYC